MADTVLAWICVALIVGGIVAFYLPKIRQTLFGTQTPDDVTPSGMKVYQGRVINLKKLSSTFFEDCLFCDVNFINEATVHIKGTNIFTSGYEVGASDCWVEAEDEQSIKGAVQFDSCIFIKCRIRTKRVATTKETRGSICNNKEPRILKTIESAGLEYVSKGDYA